MAAKVFYFTNRSGDSIVPNAFVYADTEAELPIIAEGGARGNLAYAEDTDTIYWRDDGTFGWAPLGGGGGSTDASDLTSGTLADARLSPNVPLKNAGNIFSAAANEFQEILKVDKGIQFPATQIASANANTLDDYEEGAWVPADGSGAGLSFTVRDPTYTKIGKLVVVEFYVRYPTTASGSAAIITGLPFTARTAAVGGVAGVASVGFSESSSLVSGWIGSGSLNINLRRLGAVVTNANISDLNIQMIAIYQAAA